MFDDYGICFLYFLVHIRRMPEDDTFYTVIRIHALFGICKLSYNNILMSARTMEEKDSVITIITVCFNCQDTIQKTIESVISQTYPHLQFIIIDGGSTDDTLAMIGKYKDRISLVVSEKDSGIYDAMNKGLRYARGDIIYFLNSGDRIFAPDTIDRIVTVFKDNPHINLVHGDAIGYGKQPEEYLSMYRENQVIYFTQGLCHQTLFARSQLFEKVGNFDTRFSVFADRDWLFRCLFRHNEKIKYLNIPICFYLAGGFSSQRDGKFFREKTSLLLKYCFNKRVLVMLIKNPRELLLVFGMFAYSLTNVILFAISHRGSHLPMKIVSSESILSDDDKIARIRK
jgi:glycosyltransferase involved in cell wall biosynthesis